MDEYAKWRVGHLGSEFSTVTSKLYQMRYWWRTLLTPFKLLEDTAEQMLSVSFSHEGCH